MWSNKYLGIPYKAGESDCWGLVCNIYENELGIILPRYRIITPTLVEKLGEVDKVFNEEKSRWIEITQNYEPFDVIMFHLGGVPLHAGVIIDKEYMIHSESIKVGSVVERYVDQKWLSRTIGVYRYDKSVI